VGYEGNVKLTPRGRGRAGRKKGRGATGLVRSRAWDELAQKYIVPAGFIESFGHLAFLERVRKETPNFVSFYDLRDAKDLENHIRSRLSETAVFFIAKHSEMVSNRIERKRNPVGTVSLQDLLNDGLILDPPHEVISGSLAGRNPLFLPQSRQTVKLASVLLDRKNVLLIGNPGVGKTTASLLTFRSVADAMRTRVSASPPMFAHWKDLPNASLNYDEVIRALIGLP